MDANPQTPARRDEGHLDRFRRHQGGRSTPRSISIPAKSSACSATTAPANRRLIKVLSGAYKRDGGTILINGEEATINNPRDAKRLWHRDDLPDAGARRQCRRRLQPVPGPRTPHPLGHARRRRDGGAGAQGDGPPQSEFPPLQGPGQIAVGRPAPVGGDRSRDPFQCPHPHHGRADGGAGPAGDGAGRRTDQAAQGRRHRHFPHQPRHPRRVRSRRPGRGDEERPDRRHRAGSRI